MRLFALCACLCLCILHVQGDGCRYEFFVPGVDDVKCAGETFHLEHRMTIIERNFNDSDDQLRSLEGAVDKMKTKLNDETSQLTTKSTEAEKSLFMLQKSVESLESVKVELDKIKSWILNTNESMGPKFDSLQKVVTEFMLHVQKQMSDQTQIYRTVQSQMARQEVVLKEHSDKFTNMSDLPQNLMELGDKYNSLMVHSSKQSEIVDDMSKRLNLVETSVGTIQGMMKNIHMTQLTLKQRTSDLQVKTDKATSKILIIEDSLKTHNAQLQNHTSILGGFGDDIQRLKPLGDRVAAIERYFQQVQYNLTHIESTAKNIEEAFAAKADVYINTMSSVSGNIKTDITSIKDRLHQLADEVARIRNSQ